MEAEKNQQEAPLEEIENEEENNNEEAKPVEEIENHDEDEKVEIKNVPVSPVTGELQVQIPEPVVVPPVPYYEQPVEVPQAAEEQEPQQENIIWRGIKYVGVGLYNIAYAAGGFLADFFGITRPRYEYALREYYERERRRELRERMERGEVDEFGNEIEQPNTA